MTVAARCAPEEGAGGHEAAATNSLRDGATIVAQQRVEKDSMNAAVSQSPSGQPAAVQRASRVSRAKAAQEPPSCDTLTIYGAKTGLNPKTRDTEHAPPGPFCVGPTSRSDPTLGQCVYTTFGMHTVHFNSSGLFSSLPMHRRRRWRRPRRRWRRRWRRMRPPGGRGRCS